MYSGARIVLLSADGVGTRTIQRQTGKGKPAIWRRQVRSMAEDVNVLLHDATRSSPGRRADGEDDRERGRLEHWPNRRKKGRLAT